jgi:plasmid stabilization system protein ParE
MVSNLVILPSAERDIEEAYTWYEGRAPGLGEDYLRRVDNCLLSIRTTPEAFRLVKKDFRRALLRRFPYAIYYKLVDDCVTIHAVLHNSQEPGKWRSRLP